MSRPQDTASAQRPLYTLLYCPAASVAGALIGHVLFRYLIDHHGLYAPLLPGALAGIGCGMVARRPSHGRAALCAIFAAAASLLSEWKARPFVTDDSLAFFIRNMHMLQPFTKVMYGVGAAIAYYFAYARQTGDWQSLSKSKGAGTVSPPDDASSEGGKDGS